MNPKEQEVAIGELEERVDRLRNLYEQYFLGFEKLEPTVSRKDVDRRFQILRKEQIRNTAMRFRFNVVTQKFNTYAMHWVRICRQIEEGTYKRHIRKAKARFGDTAPAAPDRDMSIDIDMDDFDATDDLDAILAEADASAAKHKPLAPDTVPPPAAAPASARSVPRQMILQTPGASFSVGGRREAIDEPEPATPPPMAHAPSERTARGAALPPGVKPRVVLRRRDEGEPPPSVRSVQTPAAAPAASSPRMPTAPVVPAAPPPASSPAVPAASSPRLAARPALDIPGGRPSGPRIVRAGQAPESSPGIPAGTPSAGAPAAGRIPVAAPASSSRLPVPAPKPAAPAPAPSAGRMPIAPIVGPRGPTAPLPPPSSPRLPTAAAARPAPPQSAPRPPMPSVPDGDLPASGEPRPRPRAPLPLPSQIVRPKKE